MYIEIPIGGEKSQSFSYAGVWEPDGRGGFHVSRWKLAATVRKGKKPDKRKVKKPKTCKHGRRPSRCEESPCTGKKQVRLKCTHGTRSSRCLECLSLEEVLAKRAVCTLCMEKRTLAGLLRLLHSPSRLEFPPRSLHPRLHPPAHSVNLL